MVASAASMSAAGTIRLFQSAQKYYHDVGLFPYHQQPKHHLNRKNVLLVCSCVAASFSIFSYFFFEATEMTEMALTFYSATALVMAVFYHLLNIVQRDDIFRTIKHYEDFIRRSKLKFYGLSLFYKST